MKPTQAHPDAGTRGHGDAGTRGHGDAGRSLRRVAASPRRRVWTVVAGTVILVAVGWVAIRPSTQRDWAPDQAVMPEVEIRGDRVLIRNIRNFNYRSEDQYEPAHYNKEFDLARLDSVWFLVEHFGDWKGPAHTLLSFGFGDQGYVVVSVEIRKEKGEVYSALKGLLKRYELMYVIGDERDLIKLRTNYRKDQVYLYPARTSRENMRKLFVEMVQRANKLRLEPEFYNTATNTCTTNIVRHINSIAPRRVPFSWKVLLPGYSDRLAYDLGLIDNTRSFEETQQHHYITPRAQHCLADCDFSAAIREGK